MVASASLMGLAIAVVLFGIAVFVTMLVLHTIYHRYSMGLVPFVDLADIIAIVLCLIMFVASISLFVMV